MSAKHEVQYYDHTTRTLDHPQKHKIAKLLEHGCIQKVNQDEFLCLPITGYNVRRYNLTRTPTGGFKCNCQGFTKRQDCSHIQALYLIIGPDQKQGVLF